jgi:hypothetical protein
MPRNDDEYDDDDRPRRRRPSDDEDDDRPARSRRRDEDDDRAPPPKKGNGLVIGILVGVFVVCCGGGGTAAYFIYRGIKKGVDQVTTVMADAGETVQSRQNLMTIGRAVHQYNDQNNHFPNNSYATRDKGGKALLSWRVHILPQLGQDALYKQFKLDEPWDSANNIRLLSQMPAVYASPEAQKKAGAGKTFYRGFSAPRGIFEKPPQPGGPAPQIRIADITDGLMNTILVVDAGEAVEWTRPDDLDFGPGRPKPTFGGAYPNLPTILILMADGSIRQMQKEVPDETLRLLIDRADGKVIPVGWVQ